MSRVLAGFVVLAMLMLSMSALAGVDPDKNRADFWGEDCVKVDEAQGGSWVADADYRLVVVKAGTVHHEFYDVTTGDVLSVGKDISHLILCDGGSSSSTSTTTSTSVISTSTTTIPPSTTTTESMTTTSTTVLLSTTTSNPSPTTTTTVDSEPTTTTSVVVEETTTTTDPPKELPLTGWSQGNLIPVAVLLMSIGGLMVRRFSTRGPPPKQ